MHILVANILYNAGLVIRLKRHRLQAIRVIH